MNRFPSNSKLKHHWNIGWISQIKKELQLWSDLFKFQAEKSLKQWLVFLKKNGLELWSVSFKFKPKNHWNNGEISHIKINCNYGQISFKFKPNNLWNNTWFSQSTNLQLRSDFLYIYVKHHWSNGWISQVKKGLQLWSDFLQCFVFSDKKGLKLWPDFL